MLMITGPGWLGALVDGTFPFVAAAVLAGTIVGARNRRNYFVPVLLAALGAADVCFHSSSPRHISSAICWVHVVSPGAIARRR